MKRQRHGFSLIELVIAILIGSILTSIALSSYGNVRGTFAVRGARNTFAALHARARAQAIEQGGNVLMMVDVSGDSVVIWSTRDGETLEVLRFMDELNVDLVRSAGSLRLCMNSRGYADPDCNSYSSTTTVEFWHNADSASVQILPLGQLTW